MKVRSGIHNVIMLKNLREKPDSVLSRIEHTENRPKPFYTFLHKFSLPMRFCIEERLLILASLLEVKFECSVAIDGVASSFASK